MASGMGVTGAGSSKAVTTTYAVGTPQSADHHSRDEVPDAVDGRKHSEPRAENPGGHTVRRAGGLEVSETSMEKPERPNTTANFGSEARENNG